MNLEKTARLIHHYLARLNKTYTREVFDEHAIIALRSGGGDILFYEGSREAEFKQQFADDMALLRKEILADKPEHGDFGFTREGAGTYFDAFICLGSDLYVIFNNTLKSMEDITQNELWLTAQREFVELSQQFAAQPAEL